MVHIRQSGKDLETISVVPSRSEEAARFDTTVI